MNYRMYDIRNNFIMNLSYMPTPLESIKNDDTNLLYKVVDINHDMKFCITRRVYED